MLVLLVLLAAIGLFGMGATIRVVARDGYRAAPTDPRLLPDLARKTED